MFDVFGFGVGVLCCRMGCVFWWFWDGWFMQVCGLLLPLLLRVA